MKAMEHAHAALTDRGGFLDDAALQGLDIYVVGGAVRDALLGYVPGDYDWVVVGATPEAMAQRGFLPVGGDFPVFLHPVTREEFALARTERKSGRGYKGFTFYTGLDVSLEDDLKRRDLTVNAIAWSPSRGFVDPLSGMQDIADRVLRHVGDAFIEDPVRLLRLARFAARFADFSIAADTLALARRLVNDGEVDALVPERVWRELAKGLMTEHPERMIDVLQHTGALQKVMPGLVFRAAQQTPEFSLAVAGNVPLAGRFALFSRLSEDPDAIARHVRAPSECIDQARLLPVFIALVEQHGVAVKPDNRNENVSNVLKISSGTDQSVSNVFETSGYTGESVLNVLEALDVFRKPERFAALVQAACCVYPAIDPPFWARLVAALRAIDAAAIAREVQGQPSEIKLRLRHTRLDTLQPFLEGIGLSLR